ncbi:hypothetical protein CMT41_02095 [Colwellia sp. MT41]|uniref:Uncharacterized protein n=1 Tax=Colwellia marinimaniae TaxID=1513592 RepID=A0ABQ0MZT6_9GAMM|nr:MULTISPECIES: hypothetical protein [Colwellia]ALO33641.1 hypothetical protein CMT41_02095 [Colwellia sp. MT41]GAW97814.1 hypothetical protein MTCD1_03458 [Colwellia marinimaniae]
MNKVIEVLIQMASDSSLSNDRALTSMLVTTDLTESQVFAISSKNIERLAETIYDLPMIKCVPLMVPEDGNEMEIFTCIKTFATNV